MQAMVPCVLEEMIQKLILEFSGLKIKEALFQMNPLLHQNWMVFLNVFIRKISQLPTGKEVCHFVLEVLKNVL